MCGRYRLTRHREIVEQHFGVDIEGDMAPRYNIAPTQDVATIRQSRATAERRFAWMKWGLIPYWAKDASVGYKMINARAETAAQKPAFGEALKKRRCLVPADGFYEWQKTGKVKQPFCITMADEGVFAFAGLWDRWKNAEGKIVETCSILTTMPNRLVEDIHDRMPAILRPEDYELWLDPGEQRVEAVSELLKPFDSTRMKRYPVSTRVNNVTNDDAECAAPAQPLGLFA
jgi:putative SOS response-associated peptidase YedK